MKSKETEYRLDAAGIDDAALSIRVWLTHLGVQKRDAARIGFTFDSILLRISERYGEDIKGTLKLGKWLGVPYIRFRYQGEAFNPTVSEENSFGEWADRFMANTGLVPSWSYRFGRNELVQRVPASNHRSEMLLVGMLAFAVVLGILGPSLPQGVVEIGSTYILAPFSDIFMGVLNVFLGPMVFLSVLTGICGIGSAADFSRIGKLMVARFLSLSFIGAAAAVLLARPFFSLADKAGGGASQAGSLLELIMGMFPSNPIQPFADGNIIQIILIAVLLGAVLLMLKDRGERLREVLAEMNDLVTEVIGVISKLLPFYLFTSLTLQFWENGAAMLLSLWKPIVIFAVLCIAVLAVKLCVTCLRLKVNGGILLKKMFPGMLIGFVTASRTLAYTTCYELNEKKLGISPELNRMAYPLGNMLNVTAFPMLFVLIAYYTAERNGVGGGISWYLILWLITPLLAYSVPPVAGGTLACIGILLSQLGIPSTALAIAATLSIILDFISTGSDIGILHMELITQADILGGLDRETLRRQ